MLDIKNLTVKAHTGQTLLKNISLTLEKGEIVGLTGESGCGKTTLMKSIIGLVKAEQVTIKGQILLDGRDITRLSNKERAALRGSVFALIPQSPMTAFDPSMKISAQMRETYMQKLGMHKKSALQFAEACLRSVNLTDTKRVLNAFPSQLSGGMLQRVAVALVYGLKPDYIMADEPTSALDEANRDIITDLLFKGGKEMGILLISHDAKALKTAANRILVMQDGEIVEHAETKALFESPQAPGTVEFVESSKESGLEDWVWEKS